MADGQLSDRDGTRAVLPGAARSTQAGWPGYWLPLVLFGLFLVLTMPLTDYRPHTRLVYSPLAAYGQGWFWTLGTGTAFLLSAAYHRWHNRRTGNRTPIQGFLVTGLALSIAGSAIPALSARLTGPSWRPVGLWGLWLLNEFDTGAVTLLIIAAGVWLLARAERGRGAMVAAAYTVIAVTTVAAANTATALTPGWAYPSGGPYLVPPRAGLGSASAVFSPWPQPAMLLPAAVLLLAGLSALAAGVVRTRRASIS